MDETSLKVKKVWMYLSRAVDSEGNTLELLLSPTRDAQVVKGFFLTALHATTGSAPRVCPGEAQVEDPIGVADPTITKPTPRVITHEKNAASPNWNPSRAGRTDVRVNYVKKLVEQDHRFLKRLTKPVMDFFSVETAGRTLPGYEAMNLMWKGLIRGVGKGDIKGRVTFIAHLCEWQPKLNRKMSLDIHSIPSIFLQHNCTPDGRDGS